MAKATTTLGKGKPNDAQQKTTGNGMGTSTRWTTKGIPDKQATGKEETIPSNQEMATPMSNNYIG